MSRSSIAYQRAAYSMVSTVGAFLFFLGMLIILIAVHDAAMPEDLTTVWMCHQMGNGLCGPETPWIQFEPANLFRAWDWVILYWWEQLYGVFH